ncbi:MAG: hypothetical protein HYR85_05805 [Planctomycetes bacterium]|nr:hypothetical protein [Planctomycetota bacterium]MBI3847621.1 hypothetical protein [Planctomycetota bacterium]
MVSPSPIPVPSIRVRIVKDTPIRRDGDFVLYGMIAYRRTEWNFALDRAVECARELAKPLLVLGVRESLVRHAT